MTAPAKKTTAAATPAPAPSKDKKLSIAAQAIAFIEKATGQKPLGAHTGTFPHIPSGSGTINILIGGTPLADGKGFTCPGYPRQRLVEVYGAESSGKTTATLAAIVAVQKAGGVAMFLDYENALHHGYAKAIGVSFDKDKLMYYTPNTLEEGFKMIYIATRLGVELIVVDSVSAMVPKSELEKDLKDPAKIGALAAAMSTNLPKMVQWLKGSKTSVIFINQMRSLIQAGAKDTDNTSGGKAVKFYASARLKLTRIRSDFLERKDPVTLKKKRIPYGNLVQIKCVKNKMDGKQGATGEVFIRYGVGIDEYMTVMEGAIPRKIIVQQKAKYTYGSETITGREQFRKWLMANPKQYAEIQKKLAEALLAATPEPLSGDDEINDDDILSDMTKEMGDDQLFDSDTEENPEEMVMDELAEGLGGESEGAAESGGEG